MSLWADRSSVAGPERLRADGDLRDELEFCERAGIPHSIFLGRLWPDPDDPYAPLWAEDDQDKAIGYLRWKRECCQGCGVHPSEWPTDPVDAEQDPPFRAVRSFCFGCQMTTEARKDIQSEHVMAVRVSLAQRRRDVDKSQDELEAEWAADVEAAEAADAAEQAEVEG